MTKYREILRLSGLGLSQQNIADSCNVSKKTVNRVLKRAKELPEEEPIREVKVEKDSYSLEDMILSLSSRIRRGESLHFRELLVAIETKSGMVTIFMAVLELLKQQIMEMRYEENDIVFTAALEGTV